MNDFDTVNIGTAGAWGIGVQGSDLVRYPPEPRNTVGSWIQKAAGAASSVLGTAVDTAGAFGGATDIQSLLQQQIEIQRVMQTVSMISNVERSKHETEMAPIRNMRLG